MAEAKAKAKKGLGRGLGAFFDDAVTAVDEKTVAVDEQSKSGVVKLKVRDIEPNPGQPRRHFEKDALEALAQSIKEHGLIQPILVKKQDNGMYMIIAGERRWRASKLAGLSEVPCIEGDYTDREVMEIALIENLQREDLNPIEEAEGYQKLIDTFGLKQEEVADRVGKSRSAVANSLRLNNLCDEVKKMVVNKELTQGHARALLAIIKKSDQIELAKKIIESGMNVRQTEKLVNQFLQEKPAKPKAKKDENMDSYFRDLENTLSKSFGTKVLIKNGKNKGKIEIEYYSNEDLKTILDKIR